MIAILSPAAFWFGVPPILDARPSSDTHAQDRRMSRSPTLDGGAVINDGGFAVADRTFTLTLANVSQAEAETLAEIAATPYQTLALRQGLYGGRVKSHVFNGANESQLVFWVAEQLA